MLNSIKFSKGRELGGKRIALCLTGSVAIIRALELARELIRYGADVIPVMSNEAVRLVTPMLMKWACENEVITKLTSKTEHIKLAYECDLILIYPATANTISKIANGICDTSVTALACAAIGLKKQVVVAPAMHYALYTNPFVLDNIKKLEKVGVKFVKPVIEEGKAKVANIEDVVELLISKLGKNDMKSMNVLVTAGATVEYIDPIRIITNKSSGKMGISIAKQALRRGANVTLILGRVSIPPPAYCKIINVETTEEMCDACVKELKKESYDLVILAAAPTDYKPKISQKEKISTSERKELVLNLQTTPKIIEKVKKIRPSTFLVGFKAEYNLSEEELIRRAVERLREVNADLIVANDVSKQYSGFEADTNEVLIVDKDGLVTKIPKASKMNIANKLLDVCLERMRKS
jgi:phosphopantothenoylcysteine decarboxylase/phosphopantothenate--cysteine ligase